MIIIYTLICTCLFFACTALPTGKVIAVDPDTHMFVDASGRYRIFHGVNAVYKLPPFHPTIDGSFNSVSSFNSQDIANLKEWGFNFVRLGVEWIGWQPTRTGGFNQTYIGVMKKLVQNLEQQGIYTLLDFHQDVMNRKFCGEGFPDWVIEYPAPWRPSRFPFPLAPKYVVDNATHYPTLKQCYGIDFAVYYFSEAVSLSWQNLYDNRHSFQDYFVAFWASVAKEFESIDTIFYEIVNEPFGGNFEVNVKYLTKYGDKANLQPLYRRVHKEIRKYDTRHAVFYEKAVSNEFENAGFDPNIFGQSYNNRSVYSYHNYCLPSKGIPLCDATNGFFFDTAIADVTRLGGGGMMTEFGAIDNSTMQLDEITFQLNLADAELQSWSYWQFKSFHDITTQGSAESFYGPHGHLEQNKVATLSRTYAQAIAGVPTQMNFNPVSKLFVLQMNYKPNASGHTEIYLNEAMHYPNGFSVSLSPSNVASWKHVARNQIFVYNNAQYQSLTIQITAK